MIDLELRDQCKHGRYDPHYWSGPKTKLRSGHSVDQQVPLDWCDGGKKIVMRLIGDQKAGRVWVEVSDE